MITVVLGIQWDLITNMIEYIINDSIIIDDRHSIIYKVFLILNGILTFKIFKQLIHYGVLSMYRGKEWNAITPLLESLKMLTFIGKNMALAEKLESLLLGWFIVTFPFKVAI